MNKIFTAFSRYLKWYRSLPKLFRFCVYYGTSPLWFPVILVVVVGGGVISYPIVSLIMLYEEFK